VCGRARGRPEGLPPCHVHGGNAAARPRPHGRGHCAGGEGGRSAVRPGLILLGAGEPLVLSAVDWCEIRNDAYDRWARPDRQRRRDGRRSVSSSPRCTSTTPIADLEQRILERSGAAGSICDLELSKRRLRRVADARGRALASATQITHVGTGQGKVEKVASNRRYLDGMASPLRPHLPRETPTRATARRAPSTSGSRPSRSGTETVPAAVHCYATHPMSYYGKGGVSADFVGMARKAAVRPMTRRCFKSTCPAAAAMSPRASTRRLP
jgi:hypothetical protein